MLVNNNNFMIIKDRNKLAAFTMLEVLFAGLVLSMATFTILGLLRLSDEMSYRAKADARVAQLFKARASTLVKGSFENLRQIAMASGGPTGGTNFIYQNGRFTSGHVSSGSPYNNNLNPFFHLFLESVDPLGGSVNSQDVKYLLEGKPLPGDNLFREIFPFIEEIRLNFDQAPSTGTPTKVDVTYSLTWINEFIRSTQVPDSTAGIDYEKLRIFNFKYTKYDPKNF
jgi:hypothetical protein